MINLTGTFTALVTPFNEDLSVDYGALRALVEWQISSGVSGLVPVGTSGECPTLSPEEHIKVISETVSAAAGRVKVIAGSGGNSTSEALELTRAAKECGADATLQVCPYYNKPSQEGLHRHYSTIADLGLPVVLYNVPGRTSREIAVSTVARLAEHPNIAAIKEASGSVERVSAIIDACNLPVLSGDDMLTLPMIAVGARGVISVASNVMPAEMVQLVNSSLAGDMHAAAVIHTRMYRIFRDLFIDTNPVPVKAALSMLGRCNDIFRLPLVPMADNLRAQLTQTMKELQLI